MRFIVWGICLALWSGGAWAQLPSGMSPATLPSSVRGASNPATPAFAPLLLEGAIDANAYRVGPGDVFLLTVGGPDPQTTQVPVTADGRLLLPQAGAIFVAELTLAEALARLRAHLQPYFRAVPFDAALIQPRQFFVHVMGAVPSPGRKTAGPMMRVEDAFLLAMQQARPATARDEAPAEPRPFLPPTQQIALRSVRLVHADGTEQVLDLHRYRRTGDLSQNPYLRDGDRVLVSAFDIRTQGVTVSGDVAFPGTYEVREGDTVLDLLASADGALSETDTRTVRITGHAPISVRDMVASAAGAPSISAGMVISVESDRSIGLVEVRGQVRFPGTYRVASGRTTLRELVEMAGGPDPSALLRAAYMQRLGEDWEERPFNLPAQSILSPGDLPFVTRTSLNDQFFQPNMAIPVGEVLAGQRDDVVVFGGDRLVIPRDERSVLVIGAVARPGFVPVVPGQNADFYLLSAGGLRRNVREVSIVRAGSQIQELITPNLIPESGDVLFVTTDDAATRPELHAFALQERQLELSERSSRRDARFRTFSSTLSLATTVLTAITTIYTIRELRR